MHFRKRKISLALVIVLVLSLVVAGCGSAGSSTSGTGGSTGGEKDKITVGIWGTITGPDSDVNGMSYGTKDYFEFINSKGGVDGYKYNALLLDGKYQMEEEIKLFKRLSTVDKAVVINGWSTGVTKALRDEINNVVKVPFVSETMLSDVIDPQKYPYIFTLGLSYEDQIKAAMLWAKSKGAKKVAFLHNDAEYGTAPTTNVEKEKWVASQGMELVANISYPMKATDLTSQLLSIKKLNPDYVYIQDSVNNIIAILRDAAKVGVPADKFIGNFYGVSPIIIQNLGDKANGFKALQMYQSWGSDFPAMKDIEEFGKSNQIQKKDQYYLKGWVEGMLINEAIKQVIKKNNGKLPELAEFRKQVRDALEGIKDFNPGGATGNITYADHKGFSTTKLLEIKNGKYTEIDDWVQVTK
ncbi:ABC transporter substrate-binding protein [Paradesulfitobacterium ferrireducens]|uniref:ABC transporter substrate-binding protein n=1 Tax=Paradesulfitobacterium ferrireducens TaxID=2816476 RepID=UPI001A8EDA42|nr:ABC transporter substrate-binding protein [Paradesulfitobacterium ferrireducens]